MSRSSSLVLALVSLVVLGGAWVASRALTAEVAAPPVPPQEQPLVAPPALALAPVPRPGRAEEPALVSPAEPPPPVEGPLVTPTPGAAARPVKPDPDSRPATEEVSAVEQAWALATGENAGPPEWRSAMKVFSRCLVQAPGNERCRRGVITMRAQLQEEAPSTAMPAPVLKRRQR